MDLDQSLAAELEQLKRDGLYRSLRRLQGPIVEGVLPLGSGGGTPSFPGGGPIVRWEGRELLLLSSNSYLGLHTHPDLIEAACQALRQYGTGAGASRLISGNLDLHEQLEAEIAHFKGCEAALLFPTGYMA
ncbi:MAG: aminotransferase class I/II-fold pyridoxal phosphate-dependent enzyme, partial [Candidatus Tectomicrobia bacterium]|nr:aminotransferase class I/II-fold pyridoxal phosphate-dependent enzyme [Candidatus Tectomicrobia bacterium]